MNTHRWVIYFCFLKVQNQRLMYRFHKLPYKYEPGVTRSRYHGQRIRACLGQKWIWRHGVKPWQSWDQHIIWGPHCKYESLHCGSSSESSLFSPSHDRQWLAKRIYLRSRSRRAKKIFMVVSSNTDSFVFHTVESRPRASNGTILWKVEDHVPQRQQFWDATG